MAAFSAILTVVLAVILCISSAFSLAEKITFIALAVVITGAFLGAGILKILLSARQLKLKNTMLLLILWWCPVVNIFLLRSFYRTAISEYYTELAREELDNARAESLICRTRYPIVLVHGIFFRDWQLVNYWGRIPAGLIKNGAEIYYGNQQSAKSVADSAAELKETVLNVIAETGAEKVNIIAHSKGGLDSRYAISRLGLDKYVATLTTVNTPHEGCDMVDYLLKKLPDGVKSFIEKRYNSAFSKLGDASPDFMAGVKDLSAERAKSYNAEMPDSPDVSYRSIMSVMNSPHSAGFPLNIGFRLIKKLNGANDGLVYEDSAVHGEHTLIIPEGRRGISHGDIIDLMRENIDGFDVREFYVGLVSRLREEGY